MRYQPNLCKHCGAPSQPLPMIRHIQHTVAAYYNIHPDHMTSDDRRASVTRPRQLAVYLCRELTVHSDAEISRRFRRDHTTVRHAIRAIGERLAGDDWELRADVLALKERLSA
jgi:chromosomal replication initiator protein